MLQTQRGGSLWRPLSASSSTPNDGGHTVHVDEGTKCGPELRHGEHHTLDRNRLVSETDLGTRAPSAARAATPSGAGVESGTFYWYMQADGSWAGIDLYERKASGTTNYP